MAITLRPNEAEAKLVDYAKRITGQSTATKALFDLISHHQVIDKELKRYKQLEQQASSRARAAESVVQEFQRAFSNINNFEK